jgi:dephospho-CoA kinase
VSWVRIVGLTGGIGSGKSEVSRVLRELGAPVIDADALTHQCQEPGQQVWREIWAHYGWSIIGPDGQLLRRKLGQRIFRDTSEREYLNRLVHPAVRQMIQEHINRQRALGQPLVVLDIPLLLEGEWRDGVDEIWVVYSHPDQQLDRVVHRDQIGPEEAQRRIRAQMPLADKIHFADHVIDNQGSLSSLREQVKQLWHNAHITD